MSRELDIFGVYVHPLLAAAVLAFIAARLVEMILQRLSAYRWVWHRGLFDVAVTIILWGAFALFLNRY
jgi:hypothetical protein